MGSQGFTNFLMRYLLTLVLVFGAYNIREQSFYHLIDGTIDLPLSVIVFAGLILSILLFFCIRATVLAIGLVGMVVATTVIGVLIWVLTDYELMTISGEDYVIYIGQIVLATVVALGMSWGDIRGHLAARVR